MQTRYTGVYAQLGEDELVWTEHKLWYNFWPMGDRGANLWVPSPKLCFQVKRIAFEITPGLMPLNTL